MKSPNSLQLSLAFVMPHFPGVPATLLSSLCTFLWGLLLLLILVLSPHKAFVFSASTCSPGRSHPSAGLAVSAEPRSPPRSRQPPNSQLSGRAEGPDVIQTEDAQNFTACTCICPEPASGGHPSLFFPLTLHVHPPPSAAVAASQHPITRAHALRLLAPVVAHVTIPPPLGGRHVQGSDPTTSGLFLCMAARTMFLRYLFSFS